MKLCILGGTGFIGRHLCEALHARGLTATVISRNPDYAFLSRHAPKISGFVLGSVEGNAAITNCDVLINLASRSLPSINWNDPAMELGLCVLPDLQFLQDLVSANPRCRIIFASSGGQIYGAGHTHPINEAILPSPRTAYAFGKYTIETALNLLSIAEGHPVTILRLANPVGRWQIGRKHGFVTTAVAAGLAKMPLRLYGDGRNVRDYFDADDLASFLIDIALSPKPHNGIFNVGSGVGLIEHEIVAIVSRVIGQELNITMEPSRPFDLNYALLDSARARNELRWLPTTSIELSVRKIRDAIVSSSSYANS